jgi:hypothetical protein
VVRTRSKIKATILPFSCFAGMATAIQLGCIAVSTAFFLAACGGELSRTALLGQAVMVVGMLAGAGLGLAGCGARFDQKSVLRLLSAILGMLILPTWELQLDRVLTSPIPGFWLALPMLPGMLIGDFAAWLILKLVGTPPETPALSTRMTCERTSA